MLITRTDIQTTVKDEYFHLLYLACIDEFKLFLDIADENLKKQYHHQHTSKFRLFKVDNFSIRSSRSNAHRHWQPFSN